MFWLFAAACAACCAALAARAAAPADGFAFLRQPEDDSDMKIAGREQKPAVDEAARAGERLAMHKQSGAADTARSLGASLAARVMGENVGALCVGSAAGNIHLQCRLLLSAVAYHQLESLLPDKVLAGVAREALIGTLEREHAPFYAKMTTSGALSFYMLCLRGDGDTGACVGQTFARLTAREGDGAAARDGAALYRSFTAAVGREIRACGLAV